MGKDKQVTSGYIRSPGLHQQEATNQTIIKAQTTLVDAGQDLLNILRKGPRILSTSPVEMAIEGK